MRYGLTLRIQFPSVKKGHSLLSLFRNTGSHVQYLTLAMLIPLEMFCHLHLYSSYTQPNTLTLVFQFRECLLEGCQILSNHFQINKQYLYITASSCFFGLFLPWWSITEGDISHKSGLCCETEIHFSHSPKPRDTSWRLEFSDIIHLHV